MSDVRKGKEETPDSGPRPGHGADADDRSGLPELALLSLAAGAVTGLVGAVFRLARRSNRVIRYEWRSAWERRRENAARAGDLRGKPAARSGSRKGSVRR